MWGFYWEEFKRLSVKWALLAAIDLYSSASLVKDAPSSPGGRILFCSDGSLTMKTTNLLIHRDPPLAAKLTYCALKSQEKVSKCPPGGVSPPRRHCWLQFSSYLPLLLLISVEGSGTFHLFNPDFDVADVSVVSRDERCRNWPPPLGSVMSSQESRLSFSSLPPTACSIRLFSRPESPGGFERYKPGSLARLIPADESKLYHELLGLYDLIWSLENRPTRSPPRLRISWYLSLLMAGIVCRCSLRGEDRCRDVEMEENLSIGKRRGWPRRLPALRYCTLFCSCGATDKRFAPPPSLVWETFGCSFRGKTRFLPELLFLFYPCFADNSKKKEKIRLLKRKD